MLTKAEIIKGLKSVIESTPSMLLPDGSINFESTMFTHHQIYPKELHSVKIYQLYSLCSALGISVKNSNDELIDEIYLHIERNPSEMDGNSTVDLLSSNTIDDSTNHSTTKQSMTAVLKCLTQLSKYQLWTFSDICGIPYYPTKAEYAGVIKNQLLDSVSPLVGEDSMVNLQFTPKLSRREASDISNMPIHINRLEVLSHAQLVTFCKMFGVPSVKPKVQLVEELRLYLTSNPCAVIEDGVLIPGNEKSLKSNSSKKALSKPVCLYSLDTSRFDDIQVICRSYGISIMISKEQLFERFRTHLHKHPEIIRADGTVDLVALANTKG
ncbi:hypothetical protein BASA50_000572 [Batrachochytrium salamandrivorans]|uniref:SAP domain-containing protein n=1 Tax=Batrachochytrium salamandrivorans TaxID=1357716 RepID=A0ABQ8ETM3_9FUNG|nr:hypothetical protein BASA60_006599 [Batrachochytrium salamandrivorans]KAH6586399.1 hypothetical protein BASA50_000572 [Batrachochytrium salamandrivorans]